MRTGLKSSPGRRVGEAFSASQKHVGSHSNTLFCGKKRNEKSQSDDAEDLQDTWMSCVWR